MGAIFSIISTPLGWVLRTLYGLVGNYGVALILFTFVAKIAMFPLSIRQQKSTAKQAAYNPMIQEINKKWAKDQRRQQEELQKMQQEYGYSPMAGCLPTLVTLPIMLGLIDVIYKPLRYIMSISTEVIAAATKITEGIMQLSTYSPQSTIIQAVQQYPEKFTSIFDVEQMAQIQNFNQTFFGIDLSAMPTLALNFMIIIPILSGLTMVAQQWINTKLNGTADQMQGSMKIMSYSMSLMFVYISFKVPAGVSLYYIANNVFGIVQSFILNKMYSPAEYRKQLEEEIEMKKAAKKAKKKVKVVEKDGTTKEKEVSEAELARIRLEKARAIDEERYTE